MGEAAAPAQAKQTATGTGTGVETGAERGGTNPRFGTGHSRNRARLILLGLAALLVVAVIAAVADRNRLASHLLPMLAAGQGVPIDRVTVTRLDTDGIALRDLALPGLTVRRAEIELVWDGPFAPRLDTAVIDGVDAALALDGAHQVTEPAWLGAFVNPDTPATTEPGDEPANTAAPRAIDPSALPALPLARIVLRNATLDIARPDGAVTVNLGAVLEKGMEGLPQARVEIDGTALGMGMRLEGDLTPRHGANGPILALGLTGRLSAPEGATRVDTAVTLAVQGDAESGWRLVGLAGPFRVAADATLPALARLAGPDMALGGRAMLDARGEVEAGIAGLMQPRVEAFDRLDGTLDITFDRVTASLPGFGTLDGVSGGGTLEGSLGGRWLRVARPVGLDIASIDSAFLALIPADFEVPAPLLDARLELRALELDLAFPERPGVEVIVWLNSPPANLRLAGDMRLNLSAEADAPLLSASALRVWGVAKAMRGVAGSASVSLEDLTLRADGATARFASEAELSMGLPGLAAPLPVVAALTGDLSWSGEELALTLGERTAVRLPRVDLDGGRSIRPGRNDPALRIADGRVGTVRLRPADPLGSLIMDLPLRSTSVTLGGFDSEGTIALETGPVDLSVTATTQAVSLSAATLRAPDRGLTVEGLAGLARIDGASAEMSASIDRLRLNGTDLLRAPVVATASVQELNGTAPRLRAALSGADGRVKVSLAGRLGARGKLDFTLSTISFAPGVLQPGDISPMAAGLSNVVGDVGATGTLTLGPVPGGQIDLDLSGIGLDVGPGRVSALTGRIAFDLAHPPSTRPAQQLGALMEIGGLLAGPIDLTYAVQPDGGLAIDRLTVPVLDGALSARGVLIPPGADRISADIGVAGVDLSSVFALIDLQGLSGTGKISGSLPVTYQDGAVAIERGRLAADGPGMISYRGGALDEQLSAVDTGVDLLLRALEDFRYEALSIEVSKALTGAGLIGLSLEGSNPAVLDGYPFRLNINLESNFDRLSGFLLLGFAATEDVLRWTAGQTR